jgi:hypothetical protein
MESTGAGDTAGENFSTFGHATAESGNIFVVNKLYAVGTELADFFTGFAVSAVVTFHCQGNHLLIVFNIDFRMGDRNR